MIAIGTSSWIAFLAGEQGEDVEAAAESLRNKQAVLPPVVLAELASSPQLPRHTLAAVKEIPLLAILDGYWERAGLLRAKLAMQGRKARLADTLIAQSCLDHEVALITRDSDFRNFARAAGLRLFPRPQ